MKNKEVIKAMNIKNSILLLVIILTIGCDTSPISELVHGKPDAKFVWSDEFGYGRHQYVYFAYEFDLETLAENAVIHMFADSRYHLKVNEVNVNWGPGRFYPEEIEYDSHDIAPFLKKGKNVIAVKVLSNGINTYQLIQNIGGFIAWGSIATDQGPINLKTPGNWVCKKATGYDQVAPKLTFAQGALDAYDARTGVNDWDKITLDRSEWQDVIEISNQDAWGTFSPRSIPYLLQDVIKPQNVMGVYSLKDDEENSSFKIKTPDATREEHRDRKQVFSYTYIYSPRDQVVDIGLWYGTYFLNGSPLKGEPIDYGNWRSNYKIHLNKGWNYFFSKFDVTWGNWDYSIILPKTAGLKMSPTKDFNSVDFMMSAGPFTSEEDLKNKDLKLPFKPNQLPPLSKGWEGQERGDLCNNPAISIAYSYYDKEIPHEKTQVTEIHLKNKSGSAVVFDMGKNSYGRIFIEYTASEGTIVDIGWAEDIADDNRLPILIRYGVFMAARHVAKEGRNYFELFRPNGHRYIHINIKNNNGDVVLHKVGSIKQNYPLERIGKFECSDRMLNQVWELGRRTMELCADDVYIDPFRERGLYAGDLYPQTTTGYVISGDTKLIRKSMHQIQGLYADVLKDYTDQLSDRHYIGVLSDYPLISLLNLKWYYDLTGDRNFLEYSYPKYKTMIDSLAVTQLENGLFGEVRSFVEWVQIEKGNAQLASTQSLMNRSFVVMAEISSILNKEEDERRYLDISKASKEAISRLFWDDDIKAFFDGYKNGEKIDHYFPASSIWPVLYDVASKSQIADVNKFLTIELDSIGNETRHNKITPYGSFYALGVLYKLENALTAEKFMRKNWQEMVFDDNDCTWEDFGLRNGHGSKSHGWSGAPTWYMSTYVLGVQLGFPESTDLSHVTIAPQSETIEWAKGVVPHPTGPVSVDWKIQGDNLFLNYKATPKIRVIVAPKGRLAKKTLWVNGVRKKGTVVEI